MGAWVIGHNLAGYLPEADTEAFETREEAVSAFVDMAQDYASADDDATWDVLSGGNTTGVAEDDEPTMLATVTSILTDDGPNAPDLAGKDYGLGAEDSRGRLVSFWLQWEPTREPGTDDVGNELD